VFWGDRGARGDPAVLEVDHVGGGVDVGVLVHECAAVLRGEDRGAQIGDADGAVPAGAGELTLGVDGSLPVSSR
jgi:hypothetical protein